ncbi:MAG: hypothetical protein QME45_09930 [Clostridiales bacterium]|nr:hypothetical protein [Clostridiales bacterium]
MAGIFEIMKEALIRDYKEYDFRDNGYSHGNSSGMADRSLDAVYPIV